MYVQDAKVLTYDTQGLKKTSVVGIVEAKIMRRKRMSRKDSCVGCDESTYGEYRPDANWHLCDTCYKDWLENEREADNDR